MSEIDPVGLGGSYGELLKEVKARVRAARARAALAVNVELIEVYWQVGELIRTQQEVQGWGAGVIRQVASDLRAEFPDMRGWSERSLRYMRAFAEAFPGPIRQQPVATLPWGHITVLLGLGDPGARRWYAEQAATYGWSRNVLTHHISTGRYERVGQAPDNFAGVLPLAEQDRVREAIADPYNLDFLALEPGHSERQLEDALIAKLSAFLVELGNGFAFVGRQYRLAVGNQEFFVDLLFYHLGLHRYIVIELKVGQPRPEHLGKLSFYVTVVDDLLRKTEHGDGATIGILLTGSRDDVVVSYALRTVDAPVAVATYTTGAALPEEIRGALPTADDLAEVVSSAVPPSD